MNREKLLQNPLPVDRVAARVVFKRGEHWYPKMKPHADHRLCETPLPIAPFERSVPAAIRELVGRRRDRMVLLGLSADKLNTWVARCDCGNYEHRSRVVRWLAIAAPDACRECRCAHYIKRGVSFGYTRSPDERRPSK